MLKSDQRKKIFAEFFKTDTGNEPVRIELKDLGKPTSTEIGSDIRFVEEHWRVDRPYVDRIRSGSSQNERTLYEVRHSVERKEFRTFFFVYRNRMVLVHFFEKKTRNSPGAAIDLAWKRMKLWMASQLMVESSMRKGNKDEK